jgi:hypothetical protein
VASPQVDLATIRGVRFVVPIGKLNGVLDAQLMIAGSLSTNLETQQT